MINEEQIMGIIMHGGNARSLCISAMKKLENKDIEAAKKLVNEANIELGEAHKIQTELIQQESNGEKVEISLLMVHAQDHLMNAITVRDLVSSIIVLQGNK